ncbi:hypothetical protein ACROYT_G042257 [Oculina patagonica]
MDSSRKDETNNARPLDKLPELENTPDKKEQIEGNSWSSFIRKFDIKFQEDCVACKFVSASVCYVCGVIVLGTVKNIPASNMPAKLMTGLFGVGLFGIGTMRLIQEPTNQSGKQTSNPNADQDNS